MHLFIFWFATMSANQYCYIFGYARTSQSQSCSLRSCISQGSDGKITTMRRWAIVNFSVSKHFIGITTPRVRYEHLMQDMVYYCDIYFLDVYYC